MRVLHIHSGNMYGGVETMLATLSRHRDSCPEMEPYFALCFEGRLSEELRESGANVHRLPGVRVSRPISIWQARRALTDLFQKERFDVVICHSAWTQAIFGKVTRAAALPLIFWSHDAAKGGHWLERWARYTPPDFAICNSVYTAQALRSFYPGTRAEIVFYPVEQADLSRYHNPEARAKVRAEFDTPQDAVVIIQVSRMEAWKGHLLHIQALSRLRDVGGWICWIAGGGQRESEMSYESRLKAEVARLGISERVRFLGQRSDVKQLLCAADIYCQPNLGPEPFGISFVEAMQAGLPVVSTDMGGAREFIDGGVGALVRPDNPAALADVLRAFILNQSARRSLGLAGRARALNMCEPDRQVKAIHNTLLPRAVTAA